MKEKLDDALETLETVHDFFARLNMDNVEME